MRVNKIKIGILIDRLNVGGVEKIAIEEVKALRLLGEDARLIVLRRQPIIEGAFSDLLSTIPIIYLDDRLPSFLKFSFKFPVFHFFSLFHITYPFLLPFVIKKNEFDYIICHGTYTSFTAIMIKIIKHINFSAFIWDPITYILQRIYIKKIPLPFFLLISYLGLLLDRVIVTYTDQILVGGNAHNIFLQKISKGKNIITIYPGVHSLNRLNKKKEDFILMVTAWKRGKNPEYILNLILKMPTIKIKMVGSWLDDNYKKEFENKVKRMKFDKKIHIVGTVSEERLRDYYSRALFFLQINDDRGFGMPALEAAAHGTTFIIPKGQGVCDLFREGIDGFFTSEMDTEAILEKIRYLISDRSAAITMGENAWRKVVSEYNWRRHAEKIRDILKKI